MKTLALLAALLPAFAFAHGGRLDRYGCHHDRKNGGYHCHGGASATQPVATRPTRPGK